MAEENKDKNEFGKKVVEEAKKLLGLKYNAQGGDGKTDINEGNFIYTVFKASGADIKSQKVDEQYLYAGRNGGTIFETVSAAIEGDIVFYKGKTKETTAENCGITNAAIFTAPGKVIRVDKEAGVKEDDLEYEKDIKYVLCRFGNSVALPADVKKETIPKKSDGKTNQRDGGFETKPAGKDKVHIIKLPKKKTYCEPIYPDFVCVSDTVPAWALSNAVNNMNDISSSVADDNASGTEAPEVAPNGKHYLEEEIKDLMDKNPNLTREKAIELLSQQDKYTKPVDNSSADNSSSTDKSATSPGDKEDENHSHGKAPNGKYYSNEDWDYLKNLSLSDTQIRGGLEMQDIYGK